METFSVLLALCEGNTPVIDGFSSQRPVTRSFNVFFGVPPEQTTAQTVHMRAISDTMALIVMSL